MRFVMGGFRLWKLVQVGFKDNNGKSASDRHSLVEKEGVYTAWCYRFIVMVKG